MRDEAFVRRHVILRHRLLDKARSQGDILPMAKTSGSALPYYERPRREKQPAQRGYIKPTRHGGVREVARNSTKNERGFTIFNGHEVQHESALEHSVSLILQADRTVADLFSQKAVVHYTDDDGVPHYTVFDFLAIMQDGTHVGVAVKPEKYRERIDKVFRQIAETCSETVIDKAVFYSNLQATREKFANARDIIWAREQADPDEVKFLRTRLSNRSEVDFWELYDEDAFGHWGRKAAIWKLIDLGVLSAFDEFERIDDVTRLKVNL